MMTGSRYVHAIHGSVVALLAGSALEACSAQGTATSAPSPVHASADLTAGAVHYPDLQSVIPLTDFSILQTSPTTREFRYTHIIANLGDGPLEIRPQYDATTDSARGFQRLYTHDASNTWSLVSETAMVGTFVYHPAHGHYHFPLAQFGLYQVLPDGSRGSPVATSPKIGFCIGDSLFVDQSLPHAGAFGYSGGTCTDPTAIRGISVGMGDLYDFNDAGQSIDATNVSDGVYWFHSVVDPFNYVLEQDKTNNITDIQLKISNGTVAVLAGPFHPSSQPPIVMMTAMTAPDTGVASGSITISADARDASGIASVQFLLDGTPLGAPLTGAPPTYSLNWDTTTVANGVHDLSAQATSISGLYGTAAPVTVAVSNGSPPPPSGLAVDKVVFSDGSGATTTSALSTSVPGELLVAFVASDGPPSGPPSGQTVSVSGSGLSWTLVSRANAQAGTSEIWQATAPALPFSAAVTSTPSIAGYHQSLTVIGFTGAGGIGASAGASASSGAPAVSLTTLVAGSRVYGVGNDWDNPVARTLGANQEMVHEQVDAAVGDTYWVQAITGPIAAAGSLVGIDDTAPTADRWNMTGVEIVPAGPAPAFAISNPLVTNRTATTATVTWSTSAPASSRVDYGLDNRYGTSAVDPTLLVNHALDLVGLNPSITYHYAITSQDGGGNAARTEDLVFTTSAPSQISCTMTAPQNGAAVAGTVAVSADASSSASVRGVQFLLDGSTLGNELTNPPFSMQWDTATVQNGSYTLAAIARDPTGNRVTSASVTVTVSNPPPPGGR